jgi:hypothetical protein
MIKNEIANQITQATTTATTFATTATYAYFLSQDFFVMLFVVTIFTLLGYIFSLVQDISKRTNVANNLPEYAKHAFKGLIISLFTAVTCLIFFNSFLHLDPSQVILISSILGANPKIFTNLINMAGSIVSKFIKRDFD